MQQKVVKEEIWKHVDEAGLAYGPLLLLEQLQLLEKYLWPGYTEDASNHHVLLLALLVNVKRREGLPVWGECLDPGPGPGSSLVLVPGNPVFLLPASRC